MIEFDAVNYYYHSEKNIKVHALNNICCKIKKGSFTLITGPSGCGKTTFLYAISGLIKIEQGEVLINNNSINSFSEKKLAKYRNSELGFIYQNYFLENTLSVLDNIILPYLIAGGDRKDGIKKAKDLLAKVGLTAKEKHYPNELSGGEQQRVSIARALINNPNIIIADEPTGNLDSKNGEIIINLLKNEHEAGRTIIMVSHDLAMRQHCTMEIRMLDGKIV